MKRFSREELANKRVGILSGGLSVEREVSLRSGAAISEALRSLGYRVVEVDVQRDVALRLLDMSIDVAFVALHGRYGEDGCIQGLLESMHIPYTGSGVLASAVGMEKVFSKQVFLARGIPTPPFRSFETPEAALAGLDELPFPLPAVVKPSREGSSVGVYICRTREACAEAIPKAAAFAGTILLRPRRHLTRRHRDCPGPRILRLRGQVHRWKRHQVPLPRAAPRAAVCAGQCRVPGRPPRAQLQRRDAE